MRIFYFIHVLICIAGPVDFTSLLGFVFLCHKHNVYLIYQYLHIFWLIIVFCLVMQVLLQRQSQFLWFSFDSEGDSIQILVSSCLNSSVWGSNRFGVYRWAYLSIQDAWYVKRIKNCILTIISYLKGSLDKCIEEILLDHGSIKFKLSILLMMNLLYFLIFLMYSFELSSSTWLIWARN